MTAILARATLLAVLIGSTAMAADALPPAGALPLSTVLLKLEQNGLSPIVEANFDDGVWEIEGLRGTNAVEVLVNPLTGDVISEHPDRIDSKPGMNVKAASAIVKSLEAAGYSPVVELDWEHDHWEVEAMSSKGRRKLNVSADVGKILSERADD